MKAWKKKPEWERRADWEHYDKLCAAAQPGVEHPEEPEHPRLECQDCKKLMTEADTHKEACNACCDLWDQADRAVDARKEFILIHGYDPQNPPRDDDDWY